MSILKAERGNEIISIVLLVEGSRFLSIDVDTKVFGNSTDILHIKFLGKGGDSPIDIVLIFAV